MKEASLEMQRIARGRLARRNYERLLKAILVQARWRSFTMKRTFQRKRNASVVLQVKFINSKTRSPIEVNSYVVCREAGGESCVPTNELNSELLQMQQSYRCAVTFWHSVVWGYGLA